MKFSFLVLFNIALAGVDAHYFFDRLILNNIQTEPWEYIRHISPKPRTDDAFITDFDYIQPNIDPSSPDLRCGRNASSSGKGAKTAVVKAGDVVGFAVNTTVGLPNEGAVVNPWDRWPNLYHPGPATAWLSRAPSNTPLTSYSGDGDWIKILSVVNRTSQSLPEEDMYDDYTWKHQWGAYQATSWNFTIPKTMPEGEYLLRFEHIYPLPIPAEGVPSPTPAQWYVNCAHIRVINAGEAVEPPSSYKVRIPGVYTYGQPELYRWVDVGNETFDIRDFSPPAPGVWIG